MDSSLPIGQVKTFGFTTLSSHKVSTPGTQRVSIVFFLLFSHIRAFDEFTSCNLIRPFTNGCGGEQSFPLKRPLLGGLLERECLSSLMREADCCLS